VNLVSVIRFRKGGEVPGSVPMRQGLPILVAGGEVRKLPTKTARGYDAIVEDSGW